MGWMRRVASVLRGDRVEHEVRREIDFHLAERRDELTAHGMPPEKARREARRRLGNVTTQSERTHDIDVMPLLESMLADLRGAFRSLRASPAFAMVAVVSLAIGIGANTAIFTLVNTIMLRSLPVSHPEAIVQVLRDGKPAFLSNPVWEYVRDHQNVLSGIGAFNGVHLQAGDESNPRPVDAAYVSGSYFGLLGVPVATGRALNPSDDVRGCPALAVLSDAYAETYLGGAASALGQRIVLNGKSFQVIGVAQRGFRGLEVGTASDVFIPICSAAVIRPTTNGLDQRNTWWLHVFGRVRAGMSEAQLQSRVAQLFAAGLEATVPQGLDDVSARSYLARKYQAGSMAHGLSRLRDTYSKGLLVLMGMVTLLLMLACANLANLLLARASARHRELAVRVSLGASRGRLLRQLLTESLLLSLLGTALGSLIAWWGSHYLVRLLSSPVRPVTLDLAVDWQLFGFIGALAIAATVLFGLVPAWRAARTDPQDALRATGRALDGGNRFTLGKALVVVQVSLSFVIVMASLLFGGTLRALMGVGAGWNDRNVLMAEVNVKPGGYPLAQSSAIERQLADRMRQVPGVSAVGEYWITPLSGSSMSGKVYADETVANSEVDAALNHVGPGYFAAMGTRVLAGRDFGAQDRPTTEPVALISRSFATHAFGTGNPVGHIIHLYDSLAPPYRIVGVVEDVHYESLRAAPDPMAYLDAAQDTASSATTGYMIKSSLPIGAVTPQLARAVAEINPRIAVQYLSFQEQVMGSVLQERLLAALSGFFGVVAMLLAGIGLYGLMSYTVARRRSEIGVRMALGATTHTIAMNVLSDTTRLVVGGLVIGACATMASTRLIASFLYGLQPGDPRVWAIAAIALLAIALLAGGLPARRAARQDPMTVLRQS